MESAILINEHGPTDLGPLKAQNAVLHRLSLSGKGKMGACIITFYKQGEFKTVQKDVLFLKALHEKSEILLPHIKGFVASDYDYCLFERFTGHGLPEDEIKLSVLIDNDIKRAAPEGDQIAA